ncbi:MAG TPA: DUF4097 family beta strand repeat-containing protein [Vicinamibacterales bacterium]|nr:DUF4097 family beta strand repeat-containing protein [Vicinamibacterales bacterium]
MILATAALTAALVVQGAAGDSRAPQTDETVAVTRGTRLIVENFAGEVIVRTWDRDAVRVQARHSTRGKITVRPTAGALTVRGDSSVRGSIDYEITAPGWMPVRVTGTYNFVTVEGAQSEIHAETTRGDVIVKGGSGAVTAKSIQGRVEIAGARGRINASSVNEGIRITDASGEITAETTNGDISFVQVKSSSVEASTINGNILYDGPPADRGRYRFTTHNGNITLVVPDTANVTFIVRTYNGAFSSAIPLNGPPRSEVRQGRRMTYTLGNGSAEMELESFGGSIRVRRPGTATQKTKDDK